MLTRDRIQEAMDDAVERGRMTRDDAEQLVADLIKKGRKQTDEVRADLEQLLGRGRGANPLAEAGKTVRKRASATAKAAGRTPVADRARREVDRARRAAGVGPNFPILGYEDLTAGQVTSIVGRSDAGRAAQGARLRAPPREPQVGAQRGGEEAGVAAQ